MKILAQVFNEQKKQLKDMLKVGMHHLCTDKSIIHIMAPSIV